MRAKAFNFQIFIEFLCYCIFAALMIYLVNSGTYLTYVTPRMKGYFYFTAIVMSLWACTGLFRLFTPQYKVRSGHCFILVIPMALLLLPRSSLSISDLSGNYVGGGNTFSTPPKSSGIESEIIIPDEDPYIIDNNLPIVEDPIGIEDYNEQIALPGLDTENKKITVANEDFGDWLFEIYLNMEKYEGYTIEMTGFVFKDSEFFKDDEFVPARLMMSCCIADLSTAGILSKYDKAQELTPESWVTIEGTLFTGTYEYDGHEFEEPQINVTKVSPADPVEDYIYPDY